MTKAEAMLWNEIKNKKILGFRFLRQYSIKNYVVDFYSPPLKLVLEVDGLTHITEEQILYVTERQNEIESIGIRFLRFTNPQIYSDLNSVINEIKNFIKI